MVCVKVPVTGRMREEPMLVNWSRLFPAVVTPFNEDLSIDFAALEAHLERLIAADVGGITVTGSVGENYALSGEEKREVVKMAIAVCKDRVPMLAGIAELTTDLACRYAEDCAAMGADGLMLLPALVYKADATEAMRHYRAVADATDRPIMIYNNFPAYGVDLEPCHYVELAENPKFVGIKESSTDITRLPETKRLTGDRYVLFAGIDDFVMEGVLHGATAFVCGFVNAFPDECVTLFDLALEGRWDEAMAIYRWIQPIFAFDHDLKFVQHIKLCMAMTGLGAERCRPPRYMLEGEGRARAEAIVRTALETRPALPARKAAAE